MPKNRISRRTAMQLAATAGTLNLLSPGLKANPSEEFQPFIPQEKKLDPKFVQQLFERGKPSTWSKEALKYIGMPIGGLCCGQVYLGGDGKLWNWDICNSRRVWDTGNLSSGKHYANPVEPKSPILYEAEIEIGGNIWKLDASDFANIEFENQYPMGVVRYSDPGCPAQIELRCWSPFIPLNTDDSSLPLVILDYAISCREGAAVEGKVRLRMESPIGKFYGRRDEIEVLSSRYQAAKLAVVAFTSHKALNPVPIGKPDFLIANFDWDDYRDWKVEGTAFGDRPMRTEELPERYKSANPTGKAFINTHQSRSGEDSIQADQHVGKLTSPSFRIQHRYLNFRIGGGNHPGKTCLNLVIEGAIVRTATGQNSLQLRKESFDIKAFIGKEASIEIVDAERGGWGHVSVDAITLSDTKDLHEYPIEESPDFGSFCLAAIGEPADFHPSGGPEMGTVECGFRATKKKAGQSRLAIAWFFPNYGRPDGGFQEITGISKLKRHYATRFDSATNVLNHFLKHQKRLEADSAAWRNVWYDSTLPYYFLERAIIPIDCLQTATSHRFDSGRFYGWEGVYCCPGTCQHVWNYAQGAARLFPELERSAREMADYGVSWQPDGTIWYRGESGKHMAHDGQAGTILRTYREHSTSKDRSFLEKNWFRIKKSIERLIVDDPNRDGLWEGEQYNTLDSSWYGKISWISSLYIAALRAGSAMAQEMGESSFANELNQIAASGSQQIVKQTYNGEYFAMVRDPAHPHAPGHGIGCHIDQVFGDSFLHMVGLQPNLPVQEVRSGLRSIWKYNYSTDAGGYMKAMQSVIKGGRWYAMPGEPGLLMTTFPRGGAQESKGEGNPDWMVGYFNECMNGFEYQAAAHMIAERMVTEGFAIVHSLHTRYAGGARNPYNEVECSDHYARSMASYGAFLTACGFAYHGSNRYLRFAPKIPANEFKAAFTAAEGWGSYEHRPIPNGWHVEVSLAYGSLEIARLELAISAACQMHACTLDNKNIGAKMVGETIEFGKPLRMKSGQKLALEFYVVV